LVTCGLIDPAWLRWGQRPTRLARRPFARPRADLAQLGPGDPVAAWAQRCLVPKLLVATQTRILEAVADEDGSLLPVVPVISVVPRMADGLWDLLAVLLAPPIAALARRAHAGAALSPDAIKLSARQVEALPLPADPLAWARGAAAARSATMAARRGDRAGWRADLDELGASMCAAYGAEQVLRWWGARLDRLAPA
jgi:hypothetical protein